MTQRDFYTAVVNANLNEEMSTFASEAIAKLDARNAKRANTPSKTQIANEPIIKAIAECLTSEPMLASEIAAACGISTQKASALAKKVEGVSVTDVKVKGKGTQKGYFFGQSLFIEKGREIVLFLCGDFFVRITYENTFDLYICICYYYIVKREWLNKVGTHNLRNGRTVE